MTVRVTRLLVPILALLLVVLAPAAAWAQGEEVPAGPTFLDRALQSLLDGIQFGAIIAITAVGLSLVFGTTHLINFAHGELVTIGAVIAFFLNVTAQGPGWHIIISAVVAVVLGAALGGVLERVMWRPLRNRGTGLINLFIITIGLSLLLRHVVLVFFGSRPSSYREYDIQQAIDLGPVGITPRDLTITVLSVLVLLGVAFMLQKTRIGTAIRAVSSNRDLAEASGIDVNRVVLVVWILGGGLAALGGVFFGLVEIITWDMGFRLLLLMFAGIILGGLGSAYGAMVGSFVVGIVAQMSSLWFPIDLQNAWALLALIVVLLIRPQGILGQRERVG
ncbi:branched-chain amino acid ABC transporter permease [Saccharomonospora marina]|uniref:branched-chain amino acid ABC transporter permease n=1 Tax=Saccharomonospora marina TaxID=632569 RepID=UPI001E4126E4|nr:branched-chain amino acid ABC transporter permease [Saccharomonospora marina]